MLVPTKGWFVIIRRPSYQFSIREVKSKKATKWYKNRRFRYYLPGDGILECLPDVVSLKSVSVRAKKIVKYFFWPVMLILT